MNPKKDIKGGLFVSFEGIEGSGKSTQSKILADKLIRDGYSVIETREPGGTKVGEDLRHIVKHISGEEAVCDEAEFLIFCASRAQLMRKVILPQLEKGGIVICDRFFDSTTAYQGYARGGDLELIATLQDYTTFSHQPNLTFLLDLKVSTSIERRRLRSKNLSLVDRIEDESVEFHEKVRRGFLAISKKNHDRICVLNAAEDPDIIHKRISDKVGHVLKEISRNISF